MSQQEVATATQGHHLMAPLVVDRRGFMLFFRKKKILNLPRQQRGSIVAQSRFSG